MSDFGKRTQAIAVSGGRRSGKMQAFRDQLEAMECTGIDGEANCCRMMAAHCDDPICECRDPESYWCDVCQARERAGVPL